MHPPLSRVPAGRHPSKGVGASLLRGGCKSPPSHRHMHPPLGRLAPTPLDRCPPAGTPLSGLCAHPPLSGAPAGKQPSKGVGASLPSATLVFLCYSCLPLLLFFSVAAPLFCRYPSLLLLLFSSVAALLFCCYSSLLLLPFSSVAALLFCCSSFILLLLFSSVATLLLCCYSSLLLLPFSSVATLFFCCYSSFLL